VSVLVAVCRGAIFVLWLALLPALAAAANVEDRFFSASDGLKLHYRQAGTGSRVLVFVPGWLMPADIFDRQLAALGDDYAVYALSPRSQGRSELYDGVHTPELRARDIDDFVRQVAPDDFTLIGWSLGVMEALDYVHRYRPAHLRALVLIDNSIGAGTPPRPSNRAKPAHTPTEEERRAYLKNFINGMFKTRQSDEFIELIQESALRSSAEVARQLLAKPYPREYYKNVIYQTKVPTWYAITPRFREQGDELRAHLPKATVTVYADAGHALFADRPEAFNADLRQFLGSVY
jgi:non-heme chloroperoxidase